MKVKLKTILHIGKIICEVGVIALGIAALCTPAAGVVIAGVVVGAAAWVLSQAEDSIKEEPPPDLSCDHPLDAREKNKTDLVSGDDTDTHLDHIDFTDHTIVSIDDVPISGDHSYMISDV